MIYTESIEVNVLRRKLFSSVLTIKQAELHIPGTYFLKLCEKADYL